MSLSTLSKAADKSSSGNTVALPSSTASSRPTSEKTNLENSAAAVFLLNDVVGRLTADQLVGHSAAYSN